MWYLAQWQTIFKAVCKTALWHLHDCAQCVINNPAEFSLCFLSYVGTVHPLDIGVEFIPNSVCNLIHYVERHNEDSGNRSYSHIVPRGLKKKTPLDFLCSWLEWFLCVSEK